MRKAYSCFALILALLLVSAGLATAEQKESASKSALKKPAAAAATAGTARPAYSVFQETIVDMTWPEIKKAAEANVLVLLPIGVIEEHGPHMGLGADTYQAHLVSRMLKTRLHARQIEAVVLPPIYWGVMQADETGSFPGSLTVRPETLKALVVDVMTDLKSWGFNNVFIVSNHGDRIHRKTIDEAIAESEQTLGIDIFDARKEGTGTRHPQVNPYSVENPFQPDFHAGAPETAIMNTYFPGEVNTKLAKELKPQSTFQPLGYVGDPANYTNVDAKAYEAMVDYFEDNIIAWLSAKQKTKAGQ